MKIYGPYARFLQFIFKVSHPRWRVEDRCGDRGPGIYLVHHQNMFGPIHAMCMMKQQMRMWSLHCFYDRQACFDQYYGYTFQKRYGWSKPLSYLVAKLLSFIVPPVLHSFGVIPVYHQTANILTMRKTLQALDRGESIILCPDVDYASKTSELGEIYTGFLVLDTIYRRKTDSSLPFIPLYCSKKQKKVIIGEALLFPGEDAMSTEEKAAAVREAINSLGRECGDIL